MDPVSDTLPPPGAPPVHLIVPVELDLNEVDIRAIGCLIEKESTTPDQYPLTTKALVTACNQKSSRDPVVDFAERDIDQAMLKLRQSELVRAVHQPSARSVKHRHSMGEAWDLTQPQLAVLAVLFLRGAQTPGELRQRCERIHPFATLDEVDQALQDLQLRAPALVRELPREPGRRESRWAHLAGQPQDPDATPEPRPRPIAEPAVDDRRDSVAAGGSASGSPDQAAEPSTDASAASPAINPNVITSASAPPPALPPPTGRQFEKLKARVVELEAEVKRLADLMEAAAAGPVDTPPSATADVSLETTGNEPTVREENDNDSRNLSHSREAAFESGHDTAAEHSHDGPTSWSESTASSEPTPAVSPSDRADRDRDAGDGLPSDHGIEANQPAANVDLAPGTPQQEPGQTPVRPEVVSPDTTDHTAGDVDADRDARIDDWQRRS